MEHQSLRLKYGIDKETNLSRTISEVKRGLLCNCVCPICSGDLVAKKGEVRTPHFAHNNGAEECKGARMSMLHKLAQEVIQEEKRVMLPAFSKKFIQKDALLITFDEVTLEEVCKDEISRRRPDCIGKNNKNSFDIWIEIYCTNPINKERRDDIIRRQQYCIEINFSDLLGTDYTKEIVRERLLKSFDDREWICHPIWDKEEEDREKEEQRRQEEARLKIKEEAQQREEEQRKAIAEALQKGAIKMVIDSKTETPAPQLTWSISDPKEKYSSIRQEIHDKKDWVMYAKTIYNDKNALESFYKLLSNEYSKVTLNNSHQFVADEVYTRCNELLPRTDIIAEVNKTYLLLLLSIWVLDRLNHNEAFALGKLFVNNQSLRNDVFRVVKRICSINKRQIEDSLVPVGTENRDMILQILCICYME